MLLFMLLCQYSSLALILGGGLCAETHGGCPKLEIMPNLTYDHCGTKSDIW